MHVGCVQTTEESEPYSSALFQARIMLVQSLVAMFYGPQSVASGDCIYAGRPSSCNASFLLSNCNSLVDAQSRMCPWVRLCSVFHG